MFFIAGITGNIGGAAAKMLLAEGKQVRAIVRVLQLTKERCRWGSSFSDTTWISENGVPEKRNWILDVSSSNLP
jgi:nucleoside-diphosphate-sugar epimerase